MLELLRPFEGHSGPVLSVTFTEDGNYFMSGSVDRSIRLWRENSTTPIQTYTEPHNHQINSVSVSYDNSHFCSGADDKTVVLWDVATGSVVSSYKGHLAKVIDVTFNQEANLVLSGSADGTVRIWELSARSSSPVQVLSDFRDSVSKLKVTDSEIVVSSLDGCIRVYDIRNGIMKTDDFFSPVTGFDLSHHGQTIISNHSDGVLRLSDRNVPEVLTKYTGHSVTNHLVSCVFNQDDSKIITGSEDNKIYIFDISKEKNIIQEGHSGIILSVSAHPLQKDLLLTSSFDGLVKLWKTHFK